MNKKEFKAESKRLLDLMINSIYTHKDIFLREIISNASDALDKLYFKSLTDQNVGIAREDFKIRLELDETNKTLTVSDNGIGMTQEELELNLGTIAKSGSLAFKQENEKKDDVDIIGQFGVGFYAAFMVSDDVTVISKAYGSDNSYKWHSNGADGYTIEPCDKDCVGTDIILKIKTSTEDDNYDEYLQSYKIQSIVKKYSDYIKYPIEMEVQKSREVEGTASEDKAPDYETYTELEIINSMVPLWKKAKSDITNEEYNDFYKSKFHDYEDPARVIHSKTEGSATYASILFIPAKAPYDYYTKEFEKGLQLYCNGVLIMDKCSDLLPDYFSFVKGLVDSEDLSLNISREMLQHDRQLKIIAKSIEKKIKSELSKILKTDRDKYEEFFKNFGLQLKFGIYNGYGVNKDTLKDLILFHSSTEDKLVTLAEYVERMKEEQKVIYYASGESVEKIKNLPQTELVADKGFEILYLTDDVDEFAIQMLMEYDGKQFKSVSANDLDLETDEEKKQAEEKSKENKDLFELMQSGLSGKVSKVKLSQRLKTHPVCITTEGSLSLEMEKVLSAMPNGDDSMKAQRVLEINPNHEIFQKLQSLLVSDKDKVEKYAKLLYNQALLIEGLPIDDAQEFSKLICELM